MMANSLAASTVAIVLNMHSLEEILIWLGFANTLIRFHLVGVMEKLVQDFFIKLIQRDSQYN